MKKITNITLVLSGLMLLAPVAWADECGPIKSFIQLSDNASKCISAIQKNHKESRDLIRNYRYCSEVRMIRVAVENKLNSMSQARINKCANKQRKEYTAAATTMQHLYQLELLIKEK